MDDMGAATILICMRTRKPCTGKTKTKSGRQRKKKLAPFCGRTLYP